MNKSRVRQSLDERRGGKDDGGSSREAEETGGK